MARKRSNGEGAIYNNERRNRWEAALVVGRRDDGKPIRRTFTAKTRKEVAAKLDAAVAALNTGLEMPDNRTTIADFAAWWVAEVLPGEGLAPRTERWYGEILETYVVPKVGSRTLTGPRALTPADVEAMTAALEKDGYSHRVAQAARTTLGKVLRAAEQRGLVGRNVARLARAPGNRGRARKVKALDASQVSALLAGLKDTRWRPIALVGATTGLRPGELLALHWRDVHLDDDPHVSVRLSLSQLSGSGPVLKAPKRDRSYRTVPLVEGAVEALKDWRRAQAAERQDLGSAWPDEWPDLVFTSEAGRPLRVDTLRQALRRGLADTHPHQLRHTYATHLLEAGTPIHHVAELLGDTVATVEAAYSHVLRPKHEVAAVAQGLLG